MSLIKKRGYKTRTICLCVLGFCFFLKFGEMVLSNQVYLKPSRLQPSRGEEARRAQEGQPLPAVSGEICHTREDMLYGWVEAGKNSFFVPQVL